MGDFVCYVENYGWYLPLIFFATILLVIFIILIIKNYRTYLSFAFISKWTWLLGVLGTLMIVSSLFIIPNIVSCPPPSKDIAIVLGNTANTPKPKLTNLNDQIEQTLLLHKGDDVDEWSGSLIFISAVKHPNIIKLDNEKDLEKQLKSIGTNPSNAKRNVEENIKSISDHFSDYQPEENGANYLEAIFEAKDNVEEGANIVVIGSGLSDSGDLDFAHDEILTSEAAREKAIQAIKDKYKDSLRGYNVIFYGLGDTVSPQENLSNRQKGIVRDVYERVIRGLGGTVKTETKDVGGDSSIETEYVVSTTDTGCGQIGLIFDNDSIKFVADQAEYVDAQAAKTALSQIKTIYDKYTTGIKSIQIDGYIAHYGNGQAESLSGERASKIKSTLIDLGIPENIINAAGKGFGPYNEPEKDRMVKITIDRQNEDCEN